MPVTQEPVQKLNMIEEKNFIETLIHDLKSPLHAQINTLDILINSKCFNYDKTQLELLEHLMASHIYMQDMVKSACANYRAKIIKITPKIQKCKIKDTVNFAIKNTKHLFAGNSQKLALKYESSAHFGYYDDIAIKRVLVNLLTNATKYGDKNSEIELIVKCDEKFLQITVTNNGKIEYRNINDVFKPHTSTSTKLKIEGNGLGLHISKRIVEAHKGTIEANQSANKVKFNFKIPIN